ncbi:hypothetical protein [Aestuariimicrobium sp. Y1814]|uniref:hypothetical protein n=1 Tax=Aestuariimicrobium sp. Y1814 TaxID=3418742 RepID=UPI003DA73335
MRRREVLLLPAGVLGAGVLGAGVLGSGVLAGCSRGPIGRERISVSVVHPKDGDSTGVHWTVDGVGGVSSSEPELSVDEGDETVVLSMTAWNSARPGDAQVALGVILPVEFSLAAPLGRRRFVDDNGETVLVQKPPGR